MYWLIVLTLVEGGFYANLIKPFPSFADCQFALHGVERVIKEEHQTIVCLKIKQEKGREVNKGTPKDLL
jgi:hypothetical protein